MAHLGTMELATAIKEDNEKEELEVAQPESEDAAKFRKMERMCLLKLDICIAPLMGAFNFIVGYMVRNCVVSHG